MAEKKYVGTEALIRLVAQLKAGYATLTHKHKISDIEDYVVDSSLSSTSTNPVQNKAIKAEFQSVTNALATKADMSALTSGTTKVAAAEKADSATTATTAANADHAASADSATSATTAGSATKATQDGSGNEITKTYQTIANATSQHNALQSAIDGKVPTSRTVNGKALTANISLTASDVGAATTAYVDTAESDANKYTDNAIANLLENSTEAVDSIYELRDAMETNADAIEALQSIASGKADAGHTHDDRYYTESEIDSKVSTLNTAINGKAAKATTLSGYGITDAYTKTQIDSTVSDLEEAIDGKAASSHSHAIADVSGLQSALDGKQPAGSYAASTHSHTITAGASDDDVVVLSGTAGTNGVSYTASHANSGVTAGTYKSVTVNAKGHVTGGTNPTTISGYGITDAYTKTQVDSTVSTLNTAIGKKADSSHTHTIANVTNLQSELDSLESAITTGLAGKSDTSHTHSVATQSANGFMSAADKVKLDGIDPSLYMKSVTLSVDANEDAILVGDSTILLSQGVEF